eukprot:8368125-Ditylum_brightwellii.AAC.1
MDATSKSIEEVFTQVLWDEFLLEREKAKYEVTEKIRQIKKEESEETKVPTAAKIMRTKEYWINVSYEVEIKETPKLPTNKSQQGHIFDK